MAKSSPIWKKKVWEKGEIAGYEQFSQSVFKRLVLQTRKNQDLFGRGLNQIRSQQKLTGLLFCVISIDFKA